MLATLQTFGFACVLSLFLGPMMYAYIRWDTKRKPQPMNRFWYYYLVTLVMSTCMLCAVVQSFTRGCR